MRVVLTGWPRGRGHDKHFPKSFQYNSKPNSATGLVKWKTFSAADHFSFRTQFSDNSTLYIVRLFEPAQFYISKTWPSVRTILSVPPQRFYQLFIFYKWETARWQLIRIMYVLGRVHTFPNANPAHGNTFLPLSNFYLCKCWQLWVFLVFKSCSFHRGDFHLKFLSDAGSLPPRIAQPSTAISSTPTFPFF